jgi:hypothetical protein
MTLCCGMSSSQSLEGSYCFHFQASSSPRIKSSTFFVCTIFPHNTPFKRKYVGQTGMLTFVCCTIWTLTRQAYSTDEYRAIDKEKLQYLKKQLCLLSTTNHKCSTLGLKLGLGSEKSALADVSWLGPHCVWHWPLSNRTVYKTWSAILFNHTVFPRHFLVFIKILLLQALSDKSLLYI